VIREEIEREKKISIGGGKLRRKIIGCLIVPKM
jgi:hypothetical protein